jgi:hypothetical protein
MKSLQIETCHRPYYQLFLLKQVFVVCVSNIFYGAYNLICQHWIITRRTLCLQGSEMGRKCKSQAKPEKVYKYF